MGSSKKQTIGYKYYLGLHLVLCLGPIDKLLAIFGDKKSAWSGEIKDGSIFVNAENIFGGEEKEGGLSGKFDIQSGLPDQTVNAYLANKLGSLVPAFRGVVSVIANQAYVGTQTYLKSLSFLASRIQTRQDGIDQWYAEKAAVRFDPTSTSTVVSVIACGYQTSVMASPDGINWPYSYDTLPGAWLFEIKLSDDKKSFLALSTDQHVCSTTDGFNWTELADLTSGPSISGLERFKGYWFVGGSSSKTWRSIDGITWISDTSNPSTDFATDGNVLLALSNYSGYIRILSTPNGSWGDGAHFNTAGFNNAFGMRGFGNDGLFKFASGINDAGTIKPAIWSSNSGIDLVQDILPSGLLDDSQVLDIAYGNNRWIAATSKGQILVREDGNTWQLRTDVLPYTTTIHARVEFFSGRFWIAVTDISAGRGALLTSDSGDDGTWLTVPAKFGALSTNDACWCVEGGALIGAGGETGDMNPAHIIRECLTDPDWGLGYADSEIDDVSFTAVADKLFDERLGLSLVWNRQTTIEDFIKEILSHIDASLFIDRRTGKFKLILIRDDFDAESLLVLDESNIEKISDFSRSTFGELTNSITIQFWDRTLMTDSSVTVQDIALTQMQGVNINTTKIYHGVTSKELAARIAQRDLKVVSTPFVSCTIYANREASNLELGSAFKLTWPDFKCNELIMRVTSIAYGDGQKNRIRITCSQDVYSLPNTAVIVPEEPVWVDPSTDPVPVENRLIFEVPYLEAVQRQGQAAVDALLTTDETASFVGAAAARPSQASLNANMNTNSGGGFAYADTLDFAPSATLAEDIDYLDVSLEIENPDDLNSVENGSWFQIDDEILVKVLLSGNVLTVKRGALDTVPAQHSTGAVLYFWDQYSGVDEKQYVEGEEIDVKITPITGKGELPLAEAPTDTIELVGRMARPYPPGNVQINGEYYPEIFTETLNVTWAHRDRKQQTGDNLLDFTSSSIGPEIGTTYNARLIDATTFDILDSKTGIIGTSASLYAASAGQVILELESVRFGLTSYQKYSIVGEYAGSGILLTEDGDGLLTESDGSLELENSIPSGLAHVLEFEFTGTFSTQDSYIVTFRVGLTHTFQSSINGTGRASFAEMATQLASSLNGIAAASTFYGILTFEAVGDKVIARSDTEFYLADAYPSLVSYFAELRELAAPIQVGSDETSYIDLYSGGVAELSNLSPDYSNAFENVGTAKMTLWVTGLTWANKKAIGGVPGTNWGRKSYPITWTVSIPQLHYLEALIGQVTTLPAAINAVSDFTTYGITAASTAANFNQPRDAVAITVTNNYGMSIVNGPSGDFQHPSLYDPFIRRNEEGTADFPSGSKQLSTLGLSYNFGSTFGANQHFKLFLDGTDYTYTTTGTETTFEDISDGLAAIINPLGDFTLNWFNDLQLIEIERTVIDESFTIAFEVTTDSDLTATIVS